MAHEDYSCEIRPGQACASAAVFGCGSWDSYRAERSLRLAPEWACLWQGCRSPSRLVWVGAQSQPHPNEVHEAVLFNPLNAILNPICRLLALLGARYIFHVSGLRVKNWTASRFLCNPKVHYCVHNIWPLFLIQSNSTLSNPICIKFVFSIILAPILWCQMCFDQHLGISTRMMKAFQVPLSLGPTKLGVITPEDGDRSWARTAVFC